MLFLPAAILPNSPDDSFTISHELLIEILTKISKNINQRKSLAQAKVQLDSLSPPPSPSLKKAAETQKRFIFTASVKSKQIVKTTCSYKYCS